MFSRVMWNEEEFIGVVWCAFNEMALSSSDVDFIVRFIVKATLTYLGILKNDGNFHVLCSKLKWIKITFITYKKFV